MRNSLPYSKPWCSRPGATSGMYRKVGGRRTLPASQRRGCPGVRPPGPGSRCQSMRAHRERLSSHSARSGAREPLRPVPQASCRWGRCTCHTLLPCLQLRSSDSGWHGPWHEDTDVRSLYTVRGGKTPNSVFCARGGAQLHLDAVSLRSDRRSHREQQNGVREIYLGWRREPDICRVPGNVLCSRWKPAETAYFGPGPSADAPGDTLCRGQSCNVRARSRRCGSFRRVPAEWR
ncbi:hypothetical protein CGCVW01_v008572 [Colletotrichum viniferum]|nr:hypothetical protein CGCVW01_v008572 [Colletotrichum viniferum]